jgi:hypothetical protein
MTKSSYREIKHDVLDVYFEACRTLGIKLGQSHEQTLGYIVYNCQDAYTEEQKDIMFHCVLLILSGDWYPAQADNLRNHIATKLHSYGIANLFAELDAADAESFKSDLIALGVAESA